MYTKSLTIMAVLTASIARADLFVQEQMNENVQGRDLKSVDAPNQEESDASGIFGLFDVDANGSVAPTEITQAYKFMNTKDNDNLKENELLKAMDGQLRAFCGVGPATEAEEKEEQEDEDNDASEEEDEEQKPRNGRNRGNRGGRGNRNRNNRGNKGRGGRGNRNRGGQDNQDEEDYDGLAMPQDIQMPEEPNYEDHKLEGEGENHNEPAEFDFEAGDEKFDYNDEAMFEDDGQGGRRLRANRRGGNKRNRKAQKGQWKKQMRNRRGGNNGKRGGKKCRRCGKVSRKSLAKKRMSKGLFGMLDANHNKNISLKEMFRPFSMADKDFDYNVTLAEFNASINKGKKLICRQYIRKARKVAAKTWYEMGVPEAERKGKN